MKTYTLKSGTRVWRTSQTIGPALARLTEVGANTPVWEGSFTDKEVTYDEEDRIPIEAHNIKNGGKLNGTFYYFRLPSECSFTVIEVSIHAVTVTEPPAIIIGFDPVGTYRNNNHIPVLS